MDITYDEYSKYLLTFYHYIVSFQKINRNHDFLISVDFLI